MDVVRHWEEARRRVEAGESVIYVEGGNSMLPLIASYQPVTLSPVDAGQLAKGDIVLVRVRRNVYTHKVTAVRRGQVQISNNRGHVNGWTSLRNVFAIVSAIDGRLVPSAQAKILKPAVS